jgi:hypothetical protein
LLGVFLPLSFDQELTLFGKSLTFGEPCTSSLQLSGVCRTKQNRPSSLIQVARFGERPVIVPNEVRDSGLNVVDWGTLAEKCVVLKTRGLLSYLNRHSP